MVFSAMICWAVNGILANRAHDYSILLSKETMQRCARLSRGILRISVRLLALFVSHGCRIFVGIGKAEKCLRDHRWKASRLSDCFSQANTCVLIGSYNINWALFAVRRRALRATPGYVSKAASNSACKEAWGATQTSSWSAGARVLRADDGHESRGRGNLRCFPAAFK